MNQVQRCLFKQKLTVAEPNKNNWNFQELDVRTFYELEDSKEQNNVVPIFPKDKHLLLGEDDRTQPKKPHKCATMNVATSTKSLVL